MNKVLAFVVFIAFIFSSCATAPVANNSQKFSSQVRVYPFANFNGGFTNTQALAFKDYNSFKVLDTKAAESAEDIEEAKAAKKASTSFVWSFIGQLLVASALIAGVAYCIKNFAPET